MTETLIKLTQGQRRESQVHHELQRQAAQSGPTWWDRGDPDTFAVYVLLLATVCLSAICLSIYVSHLPLQAPRLLVHLCLCILHVSVSTWVCLSGTWPGRAGEGLEMTVKETLPPGYPSCAFRNPRVRTSSAVCPEHLVYPPWSTAPLYACDFLLPLSSFLLSLFISVYFSCLTFLPQAMVEAGDPAYLLCPTLGIFKSQYSTAHISRSHHVPISCVGSGACLLLIRDWRTKMGQGEEGH